MNGLSTTGQGQQDGREAAGIFLPDAVMPAQFFSRRGVAATPERGLVEAVLEQALKDLRLHVAEEYRGKIHAQAMAWIGDDTENPWSFTWVCEQLGVDPTAARVTILGSSRPLWKPRPAPPRKAKPLSARARLVAWIAEQHGEFTIGQLANGGDTTTHITSVYVPRFLRPDKGPRILERVGPGRYRAVHLSSEAGNAA